MKHFYTLSSGRFAFVVFILFCMSHASAQTSGAGFTQSVKQSLMGTDIMPTFRHSAPALLQNNMPMRSARKTDAVEEIICDEDFSLWTEGTEDDPDTETLTADWFIDDSLTKQPGWSGETVTMAGGCAGLAYPEGYGGGALNTPMGDYSGHVTLTFRAKASRGKSRASLDVALVHDFYAPAVISGGFYERYYVTDTWQEYAIECDCNYTAQDAYIQFNTYSDVVIDDVKVVAKSTTLGSPEMYSATDYQVDGFTAHWGSVKGADQYLLTVYSEDITSDAEYVECSLPEHLFTHDNDTIITEYNGGRILELKVNYEVTGVNFNDGITVGNFQVEGWDGYTWRNCFSTYCSAEKRQVDFTSYIAGKYYQIRIISGDMSDEFQICYTSVDYTTTAPAEKNFVMKDEPVEGTSYTLTGLDPEKDFFYYVRARNSESGVESQAPKACVAAFGISQPVATEATDVKPESNEYTANWEPTPKAAYYKVENFEVYTSPEDRTYDVIDEDFAGMVIPGATTDEPYYLGNTNLVEIISGTNLPGWYINMAAFCDGAIGVMGVPDLGISGELQTPEIDTSNNGGEYEVTVSVLGMPGDYMAVYNRGKCGGYIELDGDWQTFSFIMTEGQKHDVLAFGSRYHYDIFFDDIKVTTSLQKDDQVMTYLETQRVDGRNNTSATFMDMEKKVHTTYAFDVYAYHTYYNSTYSSKRSEPVFVDLYGQNTDGIVMVNTDASGAQGDIFDLQGRRTNTMLKNGIYVQNGKKFINK